MGKKAKRKLLSPQVSTVRPSPENAELFAADEVLFRKDGKRFRLFIIIFIFVLGFVVYGNSFHNEFVFDDEHQVVNNTVLRSLSNIPELFKHDLAYFGGQAGGKFFRPIESISFMADYFLWGLEPLGYHMTNTLLHIIVCILLLYIIFSITGNFILSSLITALYLVHPVHTEAVTYVSGRADSLSVIFLLLMITFQYRYWRAEDILKRNIYYFLILVSLALALLCKEGAVIFPFLLIFCEYCLRDKEAYRKIGLKGMIFYFPLFILTGVWFLIKNKIVPTERMVDLAGAPLTPILISLPKAIFDYIKLSLFPVNLHMEYKMPFPNSVFQSGYFGPFIFLLLAIPLLYYLWRKSRDNVHYRIVFFGFGWFFIALIPYLNIIFQLNAPFSEHWLYIPEIGFILSVLYSIFYLARQHKWLKKCLVGLCAIVIVVYSFLTVKQNMVWKDSLTFYTYTLAHAPASSKICNNLAVYYIKRGKEEDLVKAKELFQRSLKIDPNNSTALDNLRILELDLKQRGLAKE